MADVTKLTVVSGTEGKQANVHTQQTVAQGSEVAFMLQLQKASCTREGRCWGWGYGALLGVRDGSKGKSPMVHCSGYCVSELAGGGSYCILEVDLRFGG